MKKLKLINLIAIEFYEKVSFDYFGPLFLLPYVAYLGLTLGLSIYDSRVPISYIGGFFSCLIFTFFLKSFFILFFALIDIRDAHLGFLQHVSQRNRSDRELVLTAVRKKWWALDYADQKLLEDSQVLLAAVRNNPNALTYLSALPLYKQYNPIFMFSAGIEHIYLSAKSYQEVKSLFDRCGFPKKIQKLLAVHAHNKTQKLVMNSSFDSLIKIPKEVLRDKVSLFFSLGDAKRLYRGLTPFRASLRKSL